MTYYKLLHLDYTFCLIFVTFGFCENESIKTYTEGADVQINFKDYYYPNTCMLYGPDGNEYTKFERNTEYNFFVRDIDISQNGQWSIACDTRQVKRPVNIQVTESPVIVSVNGAGLPTTKAQLNKNPTNKIYFATYYYDEGDKVDVSCISIAVNNAIKKHFVRIKYSYAAALDNDYKNKTLSSFTEVGLRTTLQAVHNNSFVICESSHLESNRTTTCKVTFLLQNTLNAKPISANHRNEKATGLKNTIKIQFGNSSYNLKNHILLQLNIPENKSPIKMYSHDTQQIIYYEYEEGEHLSVNCSTSLKTMHRNNFYLKFNGKVSYSDPFVTLNKTLSSVDNNTIFHCLLLQTPTVKNSNVSKIIRKIHLVLWTSPSRKEMAIINEDSGRKDDNNWIIYAAAGAVICFLICCSIIIYKVKKRNCYGQRERQLRSIPNRGSTLRKVDVEVDSSNYELHYSVPNNQTVNPSCHQYVNSNFQTDITYADLNFCTPSEVSNKVDNERATYAEIYHNVR